MTRQQRAIILADALLLGILAIWAGFRLDMDQLQLGGGVLVVASVVYWWVPVEGLTSATRRRM